MKSRFSLAPEKQLGRSLPRQGLQLLMDQCPLTIRQVASGFGDEDSFPGSPQHFPFLPARLSGLSGALVGSVVLREAGPWSLYWAEA